MKTLFALAAVAAVTACAAQTRTQAYAEPPPPSLAPQASFEAPRPAGVTCDIRETRTPDGLRLEAAVQSDRAVLADYDFVITAITSGGSSDITQGGAIDLTAGHSTTAGVAEIPRGKYRAVLTVTGAGGELCRLVRNS